MQQKDILEDAQVKFQKLCEMANELNDGIVQDGDHTARQFVLTAVLKSDNRFLYEILEDALFDENYQDTLKTIISGIFLNKKKHYVLAKFIDKTIKDDYLMDETFDNKEGLILASESIVDALRDNEAADWQYYIDVLRKIYISACKQDNDYKLADRLLQRFINILPKKSSYIDEMLKDIIKDKTLELNPKLVAVEVLSRSLGPEFFEHISDIVYNIEEYTNNNMEKLYMLDVTTKALNAFSAEMSTKEIRDIVAFLSSLKFNLSDGDEYAQAIINRIMKRIKNINDRFNSVN